MANHGLDEHQYRYLLRAIAIEADLRAYLRKELRNDSLVDDVLQQLYLQLLLRGGRTDCDEIGSVAKWSFTFARNRVFDHFRGRRTVSIDDIADNTLVDPVGDPSEVMDDQKQHRLLHRAIRKLPGGVGLALRFRLDGVRTRGEIAELMGTSEATVGQFITRGLRRLRALLTTTSTNQSRVDRHPEKGAREWSRE